MLDYMKNMRDLAKEYNEKQNAEWKTIFITKVDELINKTKAYNDLVIKKIDEKFPRVGIIEPEKKTLFKEF